jgi:primosomal protein N' (replication factor Y)
VDGDSMVCEVLLEIKFKNDDKTFTYHIPKQYEHEIEIGKRVTVPFGNRTLEGFVVKIINEYKTEYSIKDIIDIIDEEPVLTDELLELGNFIKKKTLCNLINAYQVMLPTALKVHHGKNISKKYEKHLSLNMTYEEAINKVKSKKLYPPFAAPFKTIRAKSVFEYTKLTNLL